MIVGWRKTINVRPNPKQELCCPYYLWGCLNPFELAPPSRGEELLTLTPCAQAHGGHNKFNVSSLLTYLFRLLVRLPFGNMLFPWIGTENQARKGHFGSNTKQVSTRLVVKNLITRLTTSLLLYTPVGGEKRQMWAIAEQIQHVHGLKTSSPVSFLLNSCILT